MGVTFFGSIREDNYPPERMIPMKETTALLTNQIDDTMQMVVNQESHTPLPEEVSNIELMEIGGCKIVLEFSRVPNPSISKVIEEMLVESSERRENK